MMLLRAAFMAAAAAAVSIDAVDPKDIKLTSKASILGVAKTLASGVMSYYPGNASTFANLPDPYYWWEAGAMMGAMLDYSYYSADTTYDETIATALMANLGPDNNFMVPEHWLDEGNDDQAFWAFSVLTAAENNFTQPTDLTPAGVPSWLGIGVNVWESMAARWNTTKCAGGLTWQIFAENFNGLNYKNSASNGGLFLISARLARLTGNQTYIDWATKVWDWTAGIGLIDEKYNVYDGTDSAENCSVINRLSFSYQNGIFLSGAAILANVTNSTTWATRAEGLLHAADSFFTPEKNATNIMWEHACEGVGTCTKDMKAFKGFLSRFMYEAIGALPALESNVSTYMRASATAAGQACTGPNIEDAPTANGTTCGQKWYVGGFDYSVGLGQELNALEVVQGLVLLDGVVNDVPDEPTPTSSTPSPSATKKSSAPGSPTLDLRWTVLSMACAFFVWGMA